MKKEKKNSKAGACSEGIQFSRFGKASARGGQIIKTHIQMKGSFVPKSMENTIFENDAQSTIGRDSGYSSCVRVGGCFSDVRGPFRTIWD